MQDELGLTIEFRPDAIVYHQHRETVRGLVQQRRGYGYASVLLYRKYRGQMGLRTLQQTYWELLITRGRAVQLLRTMAAAAFGPARGPSRWLPARMAWVDLRCGVAYKLRQVEGSIKHRIWYV